jgi:hypothetical protein
MTKNILYFLAGAGLATIIWHVIMLIVEFLGIMDKRRNP